MTWLSYDPAAVDEIAATMDLREPNREAVQKIVEAIHDDEFHEVVCDLATGVGKTYITAALIDYLAAEGVRNILIVTPGKTIQDKTIANFTPGSPKFVPGAQYPLQLVTADNFQRGQLGDVLHDPDVVKLFVFNVQQLIRPSAKTSRKVRDLDEVIGGKLYEHLQDADDLVVIADEHHVYRSSATAFSRGVRELTPRALVGLTATPDKADLDKVIYRYSLGEAIADELVKTPVIVYRKDGIKDWPTQLADACHLLSVKAGAYRAYAEGSGVPVVHPVLFVVCQSITEAKDAAALLAGEHYLGDAEKVLVVTSESPDADLAALAAVESPDSPVRAVVSVDKLKEGWDVKNIAVIVALRALASDTLTEQILGRGLRLPFGRRVSNATIDQVDIVAHDSYAKLLSQKDSLLEKILPPAPKPAAGTLSPTGTEPEKGASGELSEQNLGQGVLGLTNRARVTEGESGAPSLLLMEHGSALAQAEQGAAFELFQRVHGAPSITWPNRILQPRPIAFSVEFVGDAAASAAGAAFRTEINVPLVREALTVTRTLTGGLDVRRVAQASETATQQWLPVAQVTSDLENRVLGLGLVTESLTEFQHIRRVVAAFLTGAGVGDGQEVAWSTARAHQAVDGLADLVRRAYSSRRLDPHYSLARVRIPDETAARPTAISRYEDFAAHTYYEGWNRCIQPSASFDAKTTEWSLANLFDDTATGVAWWQRFYDPGPARIQMDKGGNYYPDFIVIDTAGDFWIIEGKADYQITTADVQAKAKAARELVAMVNDEGSFGTWHYLLCSETAIRRAHGSWEGLLTAVKSEVG